MSLISLFSASKDFGLQQIFSELNLHIDEKERLGLVGPNGSGKSTLLKIISGEEKLTEGIRTCSSKIQIEIVNQDSRFKTGHTILEAVLENFKDKKDLIIEFNKLTNLLVSNPDDKKILKRLGEASEKIDQTNAWDLERRCKEILNKLGINQPQKNIEELSGGYKKRVHLASALIAQPDVLLLDEPTNHLDAASVEWLESWLKSYKGSLVLVTHDRYFLDKITTRMVEVNRGKAISYEGNYTKFLKEKSIHEASEISSSTKFKGVLRRELAWLKKGAQARSTKQKARAKRIKSMVSQATKTKEEYLVIKNINRRIGKLIIEAKDLTITANGKKDGPLLLKEFTYSFSPEDRVGIIGPNGCGKSTLLDLIANIRQPASGNLKIGETIHIGYLDQHTNSLKKGRGLERKAIDFVKEKASRVLIGKKELSASQLMEQFLFSASQQHSPISKLSGGERRRLTLCRMLISAPNVLLLDEPTNDLDIQTLSVLEDFLENFKGCVITVSHDRYFLDRTVSRIFNFEDFHLKQFEGNYSDFIEKSKSHFQPKIIEKSNINNLALKKNEEKAQPKKKESNLKARRRSFKEAQELADLNQKIPILEKERKNLENLIRNSHGDLSKLSNDLAEIVQEIGKAEERWFELSELLP